MKYILLIISIGLFSCANKVKKPEPIKKVNEELKDTIGINQIVYPDKNGYHLHTYFKERNSQFDMHRNNYVSSHRYEDYTFDSHLYGSFEYIKKIKLIEFYKAKRALDSVNIISDLLKRMQDSSKILNEINMEAEIKTGQQYLIKLPNGKYEFTDNPTHIGFLSIIENVTGSQNFFIGDLPCEPPITLVGGDAVINNTDTIIK